MKNPVQDKPAELPLFLFGWEMKIHPVPDFSYFNGGSPGRNFSGSTALRTARSRMPTSWRKRAMTGGIAGTLALALFAAIAPEDGQCGSDGFASTVEVPSVSEPEKTVSSLVRYTFDTHEERAIVGDGPRDAQGRLTSLARMSIGVVVHHADRLRLSPVPHGCRMCNTRGCSPFSPVRIR